MLTSEQVELQLKEQIAERDATIAALNGEIADLKAAAAKAKPAHVEHVAKSHGAEHADQAKAGAKSHR